jgi:Family of unknown function (DUF5519)
MEEPAALYENLKGWVLQLPGVREAPHRVGGVGFQVNEVEFMHSHGPSWLDIRLSKEDQATAVKAGQALLHKALVHSQAGWVSIKIEKPEDLAKVRAVIQLAYENARKNLGESGPE